MFNSPLAWCPVRSLWVALDEGRAGCARRNQCRVANCPLARLFMEEEAPGRPLPTGMESDPVCRRDE